MDISKQQLLSVKKLCSTEYRAAHDSGKRLSSAVKVGVIHCTEGATAEGAAAYFTNPDSGGSAHLVVDDNKCFRTLDDLWIPWAAPPMNTSGYHIELTGFAAWSEEEWYLHKMTIHRAAYKMAIRVKRFFIPPVWLSVANLKSGEVRGITSHNNISLAFHASDHTDPGPNFPTRYFMDLLKHYVG